MSGDVIGVCLSGIVELQKRVGILEGELNRLKTILVIEADVFSRPIFSKTLSGELTVVEWLDKQSSFLSDDTKSRIDQWKKRISEQKGATQ